VHRSVARLSPARWSWLTQADRDGYALAADSLDLSGPQAVLKHWQAVAVMAANLLTDEEREQLEQGYRTGPGPE
jgi:hypothetical protein